MIYLWITISHLFVYLPTLEFTTFEQQMCSKKIGYANPLKLGTNSYKKGTLNNAHQNKKQCNFGSGWLERQQCGLHSFFWILWTSEICSVLEQSWKKCIFKNNNQISSTVTTRTWVLSTEWTRTWPSTGLVS